MDKKKVIVKKIKPKTEEPKKPEPKEKEQKEKAEEQEQQQKEQNQILCLEDSIKEIDADIKKIQTITGLKEHVETYQKQLGKINECKKILDTYKNNLHVENTDNSDISDGEFATLCNNLLEMKNSFTNEHNIDKLIQIYKEAKSKIHQCNLYVEKQKIDIVNLV